MYIPRRGFIRLAHSTSLIIVPNEQNHPRAMCANCAAKYVWAFKRYRLNYIPISQVTSFVIVSLETLLETQVVVSRNQGMYVEHVAVKNTISKIV